MRPTWLKEHWREEPGGSRQSESLEGVFWKAAALASCREAIRHCNPDSLAGQSHTARKGWPRTRDMPEAAGRGGKKARCHILCQLLHSSSPAILEQIESQRGSVRDSESKLFGVFSLTLQPQGALSQTLKLNPTRGRTLAAGTRQMSADGIRAFRLVP